MFAVVAVMLLVALTVVKAPLLAAFAPIAPVK